MENFNKVLSFVLGLVVVVVFVVVLSGRLNLNLKETLTGRKSGTISTTPTPKAVATKKSDSPSGKQNNNQKSTSTTQNTDSQAPLKLSDDTAGWNDEEAQSTSSGQIAAPTPTSMPKSYQMVASQSTPTPTTTTVQKATAQETASAQTKGGIKEIPSTGLPIGFIPAALSTLFGGVYLTRAGRRKTS